MLVPGIDDASSLIEDGCIDDWLERPVSPDPHLDRIVDAFVFELERAPVVDVCADVFGVGQYLVNCRSGPGTLILPGKPLPIESLCDLALRPPLADKQLVDVPDNCDFRLWTWDQNDAVGLQAFPLSTPQKTFGGLITVN